MNEATDSLSYYVVITVMLEMILAPIWAAGATVAHAITLSRVISVTTHNGKNASYLATIATTGVCLIHRRGIVINVRILLEMRLLNH